MKKTITVVSLILCLPAFSQSPAKRYQLDSTVTVSSDGSRLVEYRMPAYDFGPVVRRAASKASPASLTEDIRQSHMESLRTKHEASIAARMRAPGRASAANPSDYAVGEIPLQEGLTPSGARTYQIPIAAASSSPLPYRYATTARPPKAGPGTDGISRACPPSRSSARTSTITKQRKERMLTARMPFSPLTASRS